MYRMRDEGELGYIYENNTKLAMYDPTEYYKTNQLEELIDLANSAEHYRNHWLKYCEKLQNELNRDGWCRIVITQNELNEMKNVF